MSKIGRRALTLAAVTGAAVVGGDWLLYGCSAPGINLAVAQAALVGLLLWRYGRRWWATPGMLVAAAAVGLVLALAEEPSRLGLLLAGLSLMSLAAVGRQGWTSAPGVWVGHWLAFAAWGWWRLFHDARLARVWRQRLPRRGCLAFLTRWALPVAIAVVFVLLFRVANPVLEYVLGEWWRALWRVIREWRLPGPGRVALWLGLLLGVWGLLRFRFLWRPRPPARVRPPPVPGAGGAESRLVVRTLVLCNLVFAAQNLMDSGFLWGGLRLPAGMSYAAYAHRGAYPLVAAALLAGVLVLWAFRPRAAAGGQRPARLLVYVWLGQTIVLTVSALWRLQLYVQVYALTRLRVAAALWMALVAVGLALILWRIWRRLPNAWLLRANFLVLLATLYTSASLNFDGFIARWNVDRHLAGAAAVPLDLEYLAWLGPASLPALRHLRDAAPGAAERLAADRAVTALERELRVTLSNWRGWTWRRQRCLPPVAAGHASGGRADGGH